MDAMRICGGNRLEGEITVHGAKNSALPLLAATLLVAGETRLENCPCLSDVDASVAILEYLGCGVRRDGDVVTVDATAPPNSTISASNMDRIFFITLNLL